MRRTVRSVRMTSPSPLEDVDAAFLKLASAPWPVRLPAHLFTDRSDALDLPVDQARARLAHPSTPPQVRARVWGEVVRRARRDGEPWSTVAVGLIVPGLRRSLSRLPRLPEVDWAELEQEVLVAVAGELAVVEVDDPQIALQLVRAGDRVAHRLVYAARQSRRSPVVPLEESTEGTPCLPPTGGIAHAYAKLRRAVDAGVLDEDEVELIARTRLDGVRMPVCAQEAGVSARQLYRRRADAERRLLNALRNRLL
ncbi:hypothetical protein [Actinacidiphila sp. bgisy167]|uniref:hypothetical protein n=1 Tax=Actinacidiphila sp. bgisy167 TaxID=3413797 RepID=UPI003D72D7F2